MRPVLTAFAAGALFAFGLVVSGMTLPEKVIGFLDVTGDWDPSLAFVMIGAIAVHAPLRRLVRGRRETPVHAESFQEPTNRTIDRRLTIGAALFGLGWGFSGVCPGPGIVSFSAGASGAGLFVLMMFVGFAGHSMWEHWAQSRAHQSVHERPKAESGEPQPAR